MDDSNMDNLIKNSVRLEKYPLSVLISKFEKDQIEDVKIQANMLQKIQDIKMPHLYGRTHAMVIGWTGMPGVGKSSLLHTVCTNMLEKHESLRIGILAIDPTSHISGGSFLGDRTRIRFPVKENRIFFRSQPTELILGGLGRYTFSVSLLLQEVFDVLFIETVGIGQNEIEVKLLSDFVTLILQPFAGDEVQFMKAGIMEIPDIFILNKCDEESLAESSYQKLLHSLQLNNLGNAALPIFKTSALNQKGIVDLSECILHKMNRYDARSEEKKQREKSEYFLMKLVKEKYGEYGVSILLAQKREPNYFEALTAILTKIETSVQPLHGVILLILFFTIFYRVWFLS